MTQEPIELPGPLAAAFAHCSAEAQMLEHAIKSAITKDVRVFAEVGKKTSFLDALKKVTLGQAKDIAIGTSAKKEIAACVGFYEFVKMQWNFSGRSESELSILFNDAVDRRNRLAHQLLAELLHSAISVRDALTFIEQSRARFLDIRLLVSIADDLSSTHGSVATDGSSLPRFKTLVSWHERGVSGFRVCLGWRGR